MKCRFVPLDCAYSSSRVLFDTFQQLLRSTSGERNLNATCEKPGHEHLAERNSILWSGQVFKVKYRMQKYVKVLVRKGGHANGKRAPRGE